MTRVITLTATLIIAVLALASLATAEVPHMINYQGRLTDDLGQPLDTTISMTFTIYDDSTGGNPIWTETHPAVTVTAGGFSVMLGSRADLIIQGNLGDCYLEITVGSDPELSPRTQLASVPYAFRVATVDSADGGTIIGSLAVVDTASAKSGESDRHAGWATLDLQATGGATFHVRNGIGLLADIVFDVHGPNGRVGIGTHNAAANLHDNGSIYTLGGSGNVDLIGNVDIADYTLLVSYLAEMTFLTEEQYAEADLDGDGRVTLDDLAILNRMIYVPETKIQAWRKVHSSYGAFPSTGDVFYVRGRAGIGMQNPTGKLEVSHDGASVDLFVDETTGDVGVGTTSPAAKLHDNGSIYTLGGGGNVDLIGIVDIADFTLMVNYLTQTTYLSEGQYAEADMDGDGRVTWDDAAIFERILFNSDTRDQAWRLIHTVYGVAPATGGDVFYVRGRAGIGTDNPQGALDVSSTTGALIVPRMTTAERNALAAVNGMIIYNITDNQFNFYENGAWVTK